MPCYCKPANLPCLKLLPHSSPSARIEYRYSYHSKHRYSRYPKFVTDSSKDQTEQSSVPYASKLQKTYISSIKQRKEKSCAQKKKSFVWSLFAVENCRKKTRNHVLDNILIMLRIPSSFSAMQMQLWNQILTLMIRIKMRKKIFLRNYR